MKNSQGVDENNIFCVFEAQFWIPFGSGSNEWDIDSKLWRCGGVPDQGLEEHTGRRWNKQRHTYTHNHHHYHLKKVDSNKAERKKDPSDISGSSLYGVGHCITPNPDAIVASGEGRGSKKKGWKGRI